VPSNSSRPRRSLMILKTTTLGKLFMQSTIGVPPDWWGQKAANPSHVTRPS
jgi:hypothetical protein